MLTLASLMVLVGIEVFAVALSGGWAIAGLFDLGERVGHVLMGVFSLFAAWIIGGVVALMLLVSGRARRGSHLAFGPYMLIGAAVGLLVGAPVLDWYLGV